MDIQLPGINGIEAFKQIRARRRDRRDPGGRAHRLGDADRPQRDHRGRLRRLLGKPINLKEFLDTVKRAACEGAKK